MADPKGKGYIQDLGQLLYDKHRNLTCSKKRLSKNIATVRNNLHSKAVKTTLDRNECLQQILGTCIERNHMGVTGTTYDETI